MRKPTKGTETPEGTIQIALRLDPDLFDHLAKEAFRKGLAFSALVRMYMRMGMECSK